MGSRRNTGIALALYVLAPIACGGPLPTADVPTPVASAPDAGASDGGTFHTITVTLCAKDRDACRKAQGTPGESSYRIAFGGSPGTLRSREQATADLYRELRDRTAFGTRLAAQRRRLEAPERDAGGVASAAAGQASTSPRAESPVKDVLIDAAHELIDAVDSDGEVTIDVARGRPGCKVSLATSSAPDAGSGHCLIWDAARPGAHDDEAPRGHEERFGK